MLGLFRKSQPAASKTAPSQTEPAQPDPARPDRTSVPTEPDPGWFGRLRDGLKKTGTRLESLFSAGTLDESLFEELEDALLAADAGVEATQYLMEQLRDRARTERVQTPAELKSQLQRLLVDLLRPLEASVDLGSARPFVIMMVGVNGTGKTTSIGKLAKRLCDDGFSVVLAAGDTFRAAAREQLSVWGERNGVQVIAQQEGDSAAVIFDAIQSARARNVDVVLADTAGRLPTQLHLMEELKKVKRVAAKAEPGSPHAVWLVLDANTGQNALAQFKAFDEALGLTGLILTKLDGTAKGGVVAAIARARSGGPAKPARPPVPIVFIGVGEGLDDLWPFNAEDFVSALLG